MFQQGLTDTLSATEIRQSIDQTQERTKRSTAGSSAHGFSCSRRLSPLSGRNSTYRPVQISGTGSDHAAAARAYIRKSRPSAAPRVGSQKIEAAQKIRNLRYEIGLTDAVQQVGLLVSVNETRGDDCPHCLVPLEIVLVRFRLSRVVMIRVCPNCAFASAEYSAQGRALEHLFLSNLERWAGHRG